VSAGLTFFPTFAVETAEWCTAGVPAAPDIRSPEEARAFLDRASFVWHQRFELAASVETPGTHPVDYLFDLGGVPRDLRGKSVLDVGTSNGGAAFLMERWGAERVVAVDIYPPDWFGFDSIRDFLGSSVEYLQGTVYELSRLTRGHRFDYVLFWGVLYHLRHPLLALDELRSALAPDGLVDIETAVSDDALGVLADLPLARFHRGDELAADPSNWFTPTVRCLKDWCLSAGLDPVQVNAWGKGQGKRCLIVARQTPGNAEFTTISYEVRLRAEPAERKPVWPLPR
jgi:tRNA (mo5U34)-methyltransferase